MSKDHFDSRGFHTDVDAAKGEVQDYMESLDARARALAERQMHHSVGCEQELLNPRHDRCSCRFAQRLVTETEAIAAFARAERVKALEEGFKAGWAAGYYDGGEHDCRMFTPTAERAYEDYLRQLAAEARHG